VIEPPGLVGHFTAAATPGTIALEFHESRYRPLFVDVDGLQVRCDDGSTRSVSLNTKGKFHGNGRFRIDKYFGPSFGAEYTQGYLQITGEVAGPRKARGSLYYSNVSQGSAPSCASPSYLPLEWRAHHRP